jgi:lysophospholipid acyltransferase
VFGLNFKRDYLLTEGFTNESYLMKFVHIAGVSFYRIFTYLAGFNFMESAVVASGLAYNGKDANGNDTFDRVRCISVAKFANPGDFKELIANWNVSVHLWLKYYVYLRLLDKNKKGSNSKAALLTFIVSGFWHGLYPGYAVFFFQMFFLELHSKLVMKVVKPSLEKLLPSRLVTAFFAVFYFNTMTYLTMPFQL